jgi:hypothetical protein
VVVIGYTKRWLINSIDWEIEMTDTEIVMTIVTCILLVYAGILSHILYKIVGAMITEANSKKKNSLF